jgi:hypothetical protein
LLKNFLVNPAVAGSAFVAIAAGENYDAIRASLLQHLTQETSSTVARPLAMLLSIIAAKSLPIESSWPDFFPELKMLQEHKPKLAFVMLNTLLEYAPFEVSVSVQHCFFFPLYCVSLGA